MIVHIWDQVGLKRKQTQVQNFIDIGLGECPNELGKHS
jgi:hypothetical protein